MKPFQVPLLCAAAFVSLASLFFWLEPDSAVAFQLWTSGLTALTIATAVTLIWAVSGRVRASRARRVVLWLLAIPIVVAAALLGLMGLLTGAFGYDEFGAMFLIMFALFGFVCGGMAMLLVLAALPSKAAEAGQ